MTEEMNMPDLDWFKNAGFGIFVHWDHTSQQGIEISWPMVQLSMAPGEIEDTGSHRSLISTEQYHSTAATFDPRRWDAGTFARLARSCGARYVVFTARHHAGYSMFHTAHSDYSIQNSPYGGDLVREYVEAVRAEGLRVGLYYSLSDWRHPDYPALTDADRPYELWKMPTTDLPATWPKFIDYLKGQLAELLTNYGPIDILWFDGNWERTPEDWHAAEIRELIATLQPGCIVNDRLPGQGDYATPEQGLPARTPDGPWELCQTIGTTWAYSPENNVEKSAYALATYLTRVVSRGGNYLLNIGPRGDGSLQEVEVSRLEALGAWLAGHGEGVLGVEPGPPEIDFYGPVTRRGDTIFLHLLGNAVETISAGGIPVQRLRAVKLLSSEAELGYDVNVDVHGQRDVDDPKGELIIKAPEPTGALIDIIAVELEPVDSDRTASS